MKLNLQFLVLVFDFVLLVVEFFHCFVVEVQQVVEPNPIDSMSYLVVIFDVVFRVMKFVLKIEMKKNKLREPEV